MRPLITTVETKLVYVEIFYLLFTNDASRKHSADFTSFYFRWAERFIGTRTFQCIVYCKVFFYKLFFRLFPSIPRVKVFENNFFFFFMRDTQGRTILKDDLFNKNKSSYYLFGIYDFIQYSLFHYEILFQTDHIIWIIYFLRPMLLFSPSCWILSEIKSIFVLHEVFFFVCLCTLFWLDGFPWSSQS